MSHLRVAVETKTGLLAVVAMPVGKAVPGVDFRASLVAAAPGEFGAIPAKTLATRGTGIKSSGAAVGSPNVLPAEVVAPGKSTAIADQGSALGGRITSRAAPDGRTVVDLPAEDEGSAEDVVSGAVAQGAVEEGPVELPVCRAGASPLPAFGDRGNAVLQESSASVPAKLPTGGVDVLKRKSVASVKPGLATKAAPPIAAGVKTGMSEGAGLPAPAVPAMQVLTVPQVVAQEALQGGFSGTSVPSDAKASIAAAVAPTAPEKVDVKVPGSPVESASIKVPSVAARPEMVPAAAFGPVIQAAVPATQTPLQAVQGVAADAIAVPAIAAPAGSAKMQSTVVKKVPVEAQVAAGAGWVASTQSVPAVAVAKPVPPGGAAAVEPVAAPTPVTLQQSAPVIAAKTQSLVVKKVPVEAKEVAEVGWVASTASVPVAGVEKAVPHTVTVGSEIVSAAAHGIAQEAVPVMPAVAAPVVQLAVPHAAVVVAQPATHVAEPAAAAAQTFEPHTLVATQQSLEVGVATGTHGWQRVRAEMGGAGEVVASVVASSVGAAEALHRTLPGLHEYLAQEQVGVASVAVSSLAQAGLAAGVESQAGGQSRRHAESAPATAGQGWVGQDAEGATEVSELPFLYARAGGGSWVNVRV